MSEESRGASLPRKGPGITVAPSPLNGVKLELGIVLALAALVWVGLSASGLSGTAQVGIGFSFGLGGMLWLIVRARAVLRRHLASLEPAPGPRSGLDS